MRPEFRIVPAGDVPREAIAACLAAVEARDPLVVPVDPDAVLAGEAFAADAGECGVIGVGWLTPVVEGMAIEVRVAPGHRRAGVGRALYERLAAGRPVLLATCDGGHHSVRRFLEHRGFELLGVVFHQRWDGPPEDVPRAFRTAVIEDEPDGARACEALHAFAPSAWPPPRVTPADLDAPDAFARAAYVDGELAGVVLGHRDDDALAIDGLSVARPFRRRGVGRGLLADIMRRAAAEGLGVTLHVSHTDEDTLQWTHALGFWTFRTWAWYRRDAPG